MRQKQEKSLTHRCPDFLSFEDILEEFHSIKKSVEENPNFNKNRDELLARLEQFSQFELGRFFIKTKGALSGFWTQYVILGYTEHEIKNPLENWILNNAPVLLATRQRFKIFQTLLMKHIEANSLVCSVPCGLGDDCFTLDLPPEKAEVRFVGIDFDAVTLNLAKESVLKLGVKNKCEFFKEDAWELPNVLPIELRGKFNVLTSNGLNIYESNNDRVVDLYKCFYECLAPGGVFIGSALSCPPTMDEKSEVKKSEWDMTKINLKDLGMQKLLFIDMLGATWSHFRASKETIEQLNKVGFTDVEIHWDVAKIFYSFEARKPLGP